MWLETLPYLLALIAWFQVASEAPQTPETLDVAVVQLGAPDFAARQAATDLLWRAGPAAEAALQGAARSTDPEIRARATALLNRLRLGIRPDTPPEVAALIDQFRFAASATLRRQALADLQSKGHWQAILTLIRGEQNPEERRSLATVIATEAGNLISPLVERGDFDQAQEVLELVASSEAGLPQLTAFLLLTDRLDKQVAAARERATSRPSDEHWTRLAYLLRAKGDLSGAIAAAEKTSDLILRANLNAEARRWPAAAVAADEVFRRSPARLEAAAFAATFHQLAGNGMEHQRAIDALLKAANVDRLQDADKRLDPFSPAANVAVNNILAAAKTLLVNERIDEALLIMRKINPPFAHMIYWRQHRHREALEFVGVTPEKTLSRAWVQLLPTPPPWLPVQPDYRFRMAAQVARQLRELGRHEQAEQIWQTLRKFDSPPADGGKRLSMLASLGWQLGRYEQAASDAADAIAAGMPPAAIFNMLAGREGPLALAWHERLLAQNSQMERPKAIAIAISLVTPNQRRGKPPENWRELITSARASVQVLPSQAKAERLVTFGHTCQLRGDLDLAKGLFLEAAKASPATSRHIGELLSAEGNWFDAAKHYAAAVKANPSDRLASYLLGHALSRSGDTEAGAKQSLRANLAVLTPEARYTLATSFRARGLRDETVHQLEIVCRTALPDSSPATNAAQEIGNLVSDGEPRRSAHCWEQMLLHVLNPSVNFNEPEAYLVLTHVIHRVLARAALAEGQAETVAAELAKCELLMPGDVRTTESLAPRLRRAGMEQLADDLLDRALAAHRRVIEEFPASATYLNNAAWLCASAQQRLDQALQLAERATTLAPDEASYHDTLAEVHFQLGDRDAAVAAARRAADLAPHNPLFAKRLKHFQQDELKTLDAAEME